MKHFLALSLFIAAVGSPVWAQFNANSYAIQARIKTDDTSKRTIEEYKRKDVKNRTRTQHVEMYIRRMTPNAPADVSVRYVVIVEDYGGRIKNAASGTIEMKIDKIGMPEHAITDLVELEEWTVDRKKKAPNTREQQIVGYGIEVITNRQVVTRKLWPASQEANIEKAFKEKLKEKREDRPVKRRGKKKND